ncbi:MAG: hypothetical protein ACD_41C00368G0011 [uncultured bacterium]|nr:MAG: hypothetical protein ACD_41C00368G0011 [uncultured bacterium]
MKLTPMNQTFTLQGFHCPACIKLSTMKLRDLPGVTEVQITGLDGQTTLTTDRIIPLAELQAAFADTEYHIQL